MASKGHRVSNVDDNNFNEIKSPRLENKVIDNNRLS